MWFTNLGNNTIGEITRAGVVSNYADPSIEAPTGLALGSDGAMWFINYETQTIGRITATGQVTDYPIGVPGLPQTIAAGPDGALWFTIGGTDDSVARITTAGVVSDYHAASIASPQGIAEGPDRALWFVNSGNGSIGRITTGGAVASFAGVTGWRIAAGADGAMWVTQGDSIGSLAMNGSVSSYFAPTISGALFGITEGPDGAMWFTNSGNNSIGRITEGPEPSPPCGRGPEPERGPTSGPTSSARRHLSWWCLK